MRQPESFPQASRVKGFYQQFFQRLQWAVVIVHRRPRTAGCAGRHSHIVECVPATCPRFGETVVRGARLHQQPGVPLTNAIAQVLWKSIPVVLFSLKLLQFACQKFSPYCLALPVGERPLSLLAVNACDLIVVNPAQRYFFLRLVGDVVPFNRRG